jgi:hypothetical protein
MEDNDNCQCNGTDACTLYAAVDDGHVGKTCKNRKGLGQVLCGRCRNRRYNTSSKNPPKKRLTSALLASEIMSSKKGKKDVVDPASDLPAIEAFATIRRASSKSSLGEKHAHEFFTIEDMKPIDLPSISSLIAIDTVETQCKCAGFDHPLSACFNHLAPHKAELCTLKAKFLRPSSTSFPSLLVCAECIGTPDATEGRLIDEDHALIGLWKVVDQLQEYILSNFVEQHLFNFSSALRKVHDHWHSHVPRTKKSKKQKQQITAALKVVCSRITSGRYEIFYAGMETLDKDTVDELKIRAPEFEFHIDVLKIVAQLMKLLKELHIIEEIVETFGKVGKNDKWEIENASFLVTFDDETGDIPQFPHIDLPYSLLQFALSISAHHLSTSFCTSRVKEEVYSDLRLGDGTNTDGLVDKYADLLQTFEVVQSHGKFLARRLVPAGCIMSSIGGLVHWGPAGRKRVVMFFNIRVLQDKGKWYSYNRDVQYSPLVFRVRALRDKYVDLKAEFLEINPFDEYESMQAWLHDTILNCVSWRNTVQQLDLDRDAPCLTALMKSNLKKLHKLQGKTLEEIRDTVIFRALLRALRHDIEYGMSEPSKVECGAYCTRAPRAI